MLTALHGYRVLGIFAHPDDEAYSAAGTLALVASCGAQVDLAWATVGEAGTHRENPSLRGQALGEHRREECGASAAAMGACATHFLNFPDGGLAGVNPLLLTEKLSELIAYAKPQVLITLGEDGAYGHKDHIALTHALTAACQTPEHAHIRLLHTAFPKGLFVPVRRMLKKHAPSLLAPWVKAESLGCHLQEVSLVVNIQSMRQTKIACVQAHQSQLLQSRFETFLLPGLRDKLVEQEWFTLKSGPAFPAGASCIFAGMSC